MKLVACLFTGSVTCNISAMSVNERVNTYRARMRARGYRPVQLWLPDTRSRTVVDQIADQGVRVAESDSQDGTLEWLDAVNADMWADEH